MELAKDRILSLEKIIAEIHEDYQEQLEIKQEIIDAYANGNADELLNEPVDRYFKNRNKQ